MNTLKVVAAMPVNGTVTRSLLSGDKVIPMERPFVYYRGDRRRFKQTRSKVDTSVQTEVSVFAMLGKELPLGEYAEQYWQFSAENFTEGCWYLLLLEVPVEELEFSYFGSKEPKDRIRSERDLQGCGWEVGIWYVQSEWIKEVQAGYVWGNKNKFLYTCTPMCTKGQLHVATGESAKFKHQPVVDAMDQTLTEQFRYGRPLYELHELLARQPKSNDPKWVKLARANYAIEGEPLKTELGEVRTSAFGE